MELPMYGDFTRTTFREADAYTKVLFQQGRVALDADHNEQAEILHERLRSALADLIGPHGGPQDALGFELLTDEARIAQTLSIEANRAADRARRGDFLIMPGRYYVEGIGIRNPAPVWASEQPAYTLVRRTSHLPDGAALDDFENHDQIAALEVFERFVGPDDHPTLREPALLGADSGARAQLVWQVVLVPVPNGAAGDEAAILADIYHPKNLGRIRVGSRPSAASDESCGIPAASRFRGHENQFYRIEVHGLAADDAPLVKWSRDNGSVVFPIVDADPAVGAKTARIALGHLGRDRRFSLAPGQWVEVLDARATRGVVPGPLVQVVEVDRERMAVVVSDPSGEIAGAMSTAEHPFVRRWDHVGSAANQGCVKPPLNAALSPADKWLPIEDGIEAWFDQGRYRPGDYWTFAARTATGDVEWPPTAGPDGAPIGEAIPPQGIRRRVAALGRRKGVKEFSELRRRFAPLAAPLP
jgi:Family of unknown function (DUF6519)